MANFSITTTAAQDKAVQFLTQKLNAQNPLDPPISPLDYAKQRVDGLFNALLQQAQAQQGATKGELYGRASDADQATIDAILAKYQ